MPSKIEWTDEVWNPTVGCARVSPGCDHCYAERQAAREMQPAHVGLTVDRKWTGEVRELDDRLEVPFRWKRPRRVFVDSMSDLFAAGDDFMARVFAVMALTPQHTYQVLTKRHRSLSVLADLDWRYKVSLAKMSLTGRFGSPIQDAHDWPLRNVWLGVSVEDQRYADLRIPHLLRAPAAVRFLSIEPLLGPVDLSRWLDADLADRPDWVIVGGESGPGARPMHPEWARRLRDQCNQWDVPFLFKQWGEWATTGQCGVRNGHLSSRRFQYESRRFAPDGTPYLATGGPADPTAPGGYAMPAMESMLRVGKKAAGRLLDGRTWDEYPGEGG